MLRYCMPTHGQCPSCGEYLGPRPAKIKIDRSSKTNRISEFNWLAVTSCRVTLFTTTPSPQNSRLFGLLGLLPVESDCSHNEQHP